MDASNMLKPMLARGELQCVGATTLDEYRMYVEKDAALARRFQPVYVKEPSVEDTVSILRGLKERYEVHHGVRITDAALVSSAVLADRYMTERRMPDKAVDLVDEAASTLRLEQESQPAALEQIDRRIITQKIELEALRRETEADSVERRKLLERQLQANEAERDRLQEKWSRQRSALDTAKRAKERLEEARREMELATQRADWSRVSELRYSEIPRLEQEAASSGGERPKKRAAAAAAQDLDAAAHVTVQGGTGQGGEAGEEGEEDSDGAMVADAVTPDQVAKVVSLATGIPADALLANERKRLLQMETELRRRVIGQEAVRATRPVAAVAVAAADDPLPPRSPSPPARAAGGAIRERLRAPVARRSAPAQPADGGVHVPGPHWCVRPGPARGAGCLRGR